MAQKRMIDKKISISEDIAGLPTEAQLLFTWMIPHADDVGLLPISPRSIKALVVPMNDSFTPESIGFHLESISKAGLIQQFEWFGDNFWRIVNFSEHQTLKRDRKPLSIAKHVDDWKILDSIWKTLETQVSKEVSKEEKEVRNKEALEKLKQELIQKKVIK